MKTQSLIIRSEMLSRRIATLNSANQNYLFYRNAIKHPALSDIQQSVNLVCLTQWRNKRREIIEGINNLVTFKF